MNNFAKKIILASNSPRRKELLTLAGLEFDVVKSDYREEKCKSYDEKNIIKNSQGKALDVAQKINFDAIIIGADTMVILDSVCLNKPQDISEAVFMLKKLSGKTHQVVTAITVVDTMRMIPDTSVVTTDVTFRKLGEDEILNYIKTKNPLDKAGSYGIQDFITADGVQNPPGCSFVQKICGDYYNVVGISVNTLLEMLKKY